MVQHKFNYTQVVESLKYKNSGFVPNSDDDTSMTVTPYTEVIIFDN